MRVTTIWGGALRGLFGAAAAAGLLYVVWAIYASGQVVGASCALAFFVLVFYIYLSPRTYTYRYLFPGLAGIGIFVLFPLLYTVQISLTNYSASNLLSFERATQYLLEETVKGEDPGYQFTLYPDGHEFRLLLQPRLDEEDEQNAAKNTSLRENTYVSPSLALLVGNIPPVVEMTSLKEASFQPNTALPLSEIIKRRNVLSTIKLKLPNGKLLSYSGLREFAQIDPLYKKNADGTLSNTKTGQLLKADFSTGFYTTVQGEKIQPGFKVFIGTGNYERMATDKEFKGPFTAIFLWTVLFAALTVFLTLVVGCTLAVLLNWEALRFRTIYRTLLFLPYAVPGFISILVFKGLFNNNFGEINLILNALFGIKPAWFADPLLAKIMILIVNTWLGYPYVMVLCTGLIKAIPADLYEASAIAGAKPLTNFFKITAPLIIKPLTPLLIASFAFNFNNFVLITLLTGGRPDFLNTKVPAGTTDILVSYTYRIAFQDSGQNFGLAAAISSLIFILVVLLSMANLKLARVNREESTY